MVSRAVCSCPSCGNMTVAIDTQDILGSAVAQAWCEACLIHLASVEFAEDREAAVHQAIHAIQAWRPRSDGREILITQVADPHNFFGWVCCGCKKIVMETELYCPDCFRAKSRRDPVEVSRTRQRRKARLKKTPCPACHGTSWKINRFGDGACQPCMTLVSAVVASRA